MKVLDLFSGIGGFALGLEACGTFTTEQFVELDPFCRQVLAKHWPEVPIHADIRSYTAGEGAFDVLVGGFPCQDISIAGSGLGLAGARSGLWAEYFRLIKEVKPAYAIIENVKALFSRGLGQVLSDIASIGYDAEWHNLPAAVFGHLQARERVWIIAYPHQNRSEGLLTGADIGAARQRWSRSEEDLQSIIDAPFEHGSSHPKPLLRRVDGRIPDRAHRVGACGNAVSPRVVEVLGRAILRDVQARGSTETY